LEDRLHNYAVPTIFIALNGLPHNRDRKADKPNLPFPDITEQTEEASEEDLKRWETLTETGELSQPSGPISFVVLTQRLLHFRMISSISVDTVS
jgi:hypothetical protein